MTSNAVVVHSLANGAGGWGHMTGAMTVYGWIVMALFWFLIVWVIWSLGPDRKRLPRSPLDLLDERYARGEIDRDRYLQAKTDLDRWGGPDRG